MKFATWMLSLNRTVRAFIFSILALTAPYYLSGMEISPVYIALVIMVSGISSTAFVYGFSRLAIGERRKLMILSLLFSASLFLLFVYHGIALYIIAIVLGGIPLSGRDFTHNQAIEQFSISVNENERRSKNFAFSLYNFGSYASAASASASIFFFYESNIQAFYEVCFFLSLVQFVSYGLLSIPMDTRKAERRQKLKNRDVSILSALFSIDSLGGGLVVTSMITLWFKLVYSATLSQIGFIFVIVNIVTAISIILSSVISNRMGLVRTMVYTHLISNVFLVLIPLIHSFAIGQIFLYLRQTTSQMDVPARDSFTNTLIPQEQRIQSNARFVMVRNFFQIPGPAIGGAILEFYPPLLFIVAGGSKILYDLMFFGRYHKTGL
ncbi:MAG: MFS transporter [Candidatus Thermoplasmatota archaeon]|nr:MFS transporter [Candidatus Thermoplasmatota archaeon]